MIVHRTYCVSRIRLALAGRVNSEKCAQKHGGLWDMKKSRVLKNGGIFLALLALLACCIIRCSQTDKGSSASDEDKTEQEKSLDYPQAGYALCLAEPADISPRVQNLEPELYNSRFEIEDSLPEGLSFRSRSGRIVGAPRRHPLTSGGANLTSQEYSVYFFDDVAQTRKEYARLKLHFLDMSKLKHASLQLESRRNYEIAPLYRDLPYTKAQFDKYGLSFSLEPQELPSGFLMDPQTGSISGNSPTLFKAQNYRVTLNSSVCASHSYDFQISSVFVNHPPDILTTEIVLPLTSRVYRTSRLDRIGDALIDNDVHYVRNKFTVESRFPIEYNDSEGDSVEFSLESQTYNNRYAFCKKKYNYDSKRKRVTVTTQAEQDCRAILFGVTTQGNVYMYQDLEGTRDKLMPLYEFEPESLVILAKDLNTGKVTRKTITVRGSSRMKNCDGHSAGSLAKYKCLHTQELPALVQNTDRASLRANLPKLSQSKGNYRLVFEESFNGSGLESLDARVWNRRPNYSDCASDIRDGYYIYSHASGANDPCNPLINTAGKFEFKYGYIETRVSLPLKYQDTYYNRNFVLWGRYSSPSHWDATFAVLRRYDLLALDTNQAALSYVGSEIDIYEYWNRTIYAHAYAATPFDMENSAGGLTSTSSIFKHIDYYVRFCNQSETRFRVLYLEGSDLCSDEASNNNRVVMVIGVEWTPAGYRRFYRLEGTDDKLKLYPQNALRFSYQNKKIKQSADGSYDYQNDGSSKSYYSWLKWSEDLAIVSQNTHYQKADDPQSRLEKFAVQHIPAYLYFNSHGSNMDINDKAKVDYVRVFQPLDKYASLTPVYQ